MVRAQPPILLLSRSQLRCHRLVRKLDNPMAKRFSRVDAQIHSILLPNDMVMGEWAIEDRVDDRLRGEVAYYDSYRRSLWRTIFTESAHNCGWAIVVRRQHLASPAC